MIQRWSFRTLFGTALAASTIAACGGRSSSSAEPVASARQTVTSFMRAVADSNLTKMAELWGSSKGSAASTHEPADYERRIVLIQSYLRSDDYRIAADGGDGDGRRSMQVELRRQACTWSVPFTVIKPKTGGWVVSNIDLTRAGNPARPCDPNAQAQGDSTSKP